METKILHEFLVLSKIKNYARAADELFTTEATLSRHIVSLERELGSPLFYRTTRKVELTEFGEDFLPYAVRIIQTVEECDSYLLNKKKAEKSQLFVGVPGNVLVYEKVKVTLLKFAAENPDYSIELVQEEDENQLISKLRNNECDLVIMREPAAVTINDDFQRITVVADEPLCALLPVNHPLAASGYVDLFDLRNENFLLPPSFSYTYKIFMAACGKRGIKVRLSPSPRGREIASTIASLGLGVPILSRTPANDAADQSVSVTEITPGICQDINVIYPQMNKYSPIMKKALKYFRSVSVNNDH